MCFVYYSWEHRGNILVSQQQKMAPYSDLPWYIMNEWLTSLTFTLHRETLLLLHFPVCSSSFILSKDIYCNVKCYFYLQKLY